MQRILFFSIAVSWDGHGQGMDVMVNRECPSPLLGMSAIRIHVLQGILKESDLGIIAGTRGIEVVQFLCKIESEQKRI
ncbi:hypothetical protein GOP47_0026207 [Adiantum capillus-veneris]|nr:hypothetical protein GOP47_0026207 [Adiantum capillus-veneris]